MESATSLAALMAISGFAANTGSMAARDDGGRAARAEIGISVTVRPRFTFERSTATSSRCGSYKLPQLPFCISSNMPEAKVLFRVVANGSTYRHAANFLSRGDVSSFRQTKNEAPNSRADGPSEAQATEFTEGKFMVLITPL